MLRIRFDDVEWSELEQKASDAGLSKSALVRTCLDRVRIRNRDDERKRIAMLNRINANLNMIAKWCNTYKHNANSIEVLSALISIEKEVKKIGEK